MLCIQIYLQTAAKFLKSTKSPSPNRHTVVTGLKLCDELRRVTLAA